MPLKLTITSYQRLSPGQEATRILESGLIRIGRASRNDWILQDPERILSSEHCIVHCKNDGYFLIDTSTNGTFLNDSEERIPRSQEVELKDGDHFVLGEYEITATITDDEIGQEQESDGPVTAIALSPPDLIPPSDIVPAESPADPAKPAFNDLLADSRIGLNPLGLGHSPAGARTSGAATEPPDDIGGPEGAVYEPPELLLPNAPPDVQHQASTPAAEPPPTDQAAPPIDEVPNLIPDDWWQNLAPAPLQAPPPPSQPPFTPPVPAPPVAAPKSVPSVAPAPKPAAPLAAQSAQPGTPDLLQAFLGSAGLPHLTLTGEQQLAVMNNLGAIFHETVQGLMDILLARGDIKGEFRLNRTVIGPVENNPLKTPPGQPPLRVEQVMALLLVGQKGAYMPPVQAVQEGFNDIKAHQLAVMAGIQAALSRLLARFDPSHLETRLQQSVLDNLWPANRKAKYWDLFNAEYQAIAREAEDDFNELFGDEFARAYEERVQSH